MDLDRDQLVRRKDLSAVTIHQFLTVIIRNLRITVFNDLFIGRNFTPILTCCYHRQTLILITLRNTLPRLDYRINFGPSTFSKTFHPFVAGITIYFFNQLYFCSTYFFSLEYHLNRFITSRVLSPITLLVTI